MSKAKTGGNKKSSSPSSIAYWLRASNGKFAETHKARRIARHAKRMGLTKAQVLKATMTPVVYPKQPEKTEKQFAIFDKPVASMVYRDTYGVVIRYPRFIVKNGVTVDVRFD